MKRAIREALLRKHPSLVKLAAYREVKARALDDMERTKWLIKRLDGWIEEEFYQQMADALFKGIIYLTPARELCTIESSKQGSTLKESQR